MEPYDNAILILRTPQKGISKSLKPLIVSMISIGRDADWASHFQLLSWFKLRFWGARGLGILGVRVWGIIKGLGIRGQWWWW